MEAVSRVMQQALAERAFTHASVLVAREGQLVFQRAFGRARADAVFDLASLTKPFATAALVAQAIADGKLALEDPLARWLPLRSAAPLAAVRVEHLLAHCSGLAAWKPFYQTVNGGDFVAAKRALRRAVLKEPLVYEPGTAACYSDLGFILLGWVLERAGGARLEGLAERGLFRPLGLTRTAFINLRLPVSERPPWAFVPTERCPRRGRLCGEVHDDNAHRMGGVSGHAGLFGSAYDLHLLLREWLAAYHGQRSLLCSATVRRMWEARPVPESSWALGWDRPSGPRPSGGKLFSSASCRGHLGFTGTSVWCDLASASHAIILTNRVYFGREPNPLKRLRPLLHNAIGRSLKSWR